MEKFDLDISLTDQEHYIMVFDSSVSAWTEALSKALAQTPESLSLMTRQAETFARENLSWKESIGNLIDWINETELESSDLS